MRPWIALWLAPALAATGCKWTDFDDLEDAAWVESTLKPNDRSNNWAMGITRGKRTSGGSGGSLAVVGGNQSVYNEIIYAPAGGAKHGDTPVGLTSMHGVGNLEASPLFLADPASDEVVLVTSGGSSSILVVRILGAGQSPLHQVFGPGRPDAATYMQPPDRPDTAAALGTAPLVAQDDEVYGTFYENAPNPQPRCRLLDDEGNPAFVRALGAFRIAPKPTDDVLVWTRTGKLLAYDGAVFHGGLADNPVCPPAGATPLAGHPVGSTPFEPAALSRIHVFEAEGASYALLQGHADPVKGFLALYDLGTMAAIGAPRGDDRLRSAALLELEGQRYVVAGYPTATVNNTAAGQVLVLALDLTTGLGPTPEMVLHDAQPTSEQAFGRSVTVMPYNDTSVIAVAAMNEVFLYYRTNLYDDARQGR